MSLTRIQLFNLINEHYNLEEFRTLCFWINFAYDNLGGEGLRSKIRELIEALERTNRLAELETIVCHDLPQRCNEIHEQIQRRFHLRAPSPPQSFIGQEALLAKLAQDLIQRRGQVHTLVGLSGVGKTSLAAKVVEEVHDYFSNILWFSLESNPHANMLWAEIVNFYGGYADAYPKRTAIAFLEQEQPLLVLDNAETAQEVAGEIIRGRAGATVLITSRYRLLGAVNRRPISVNPLPRATAIHLLQNRTEQGDDESANEICHLVGDLPLALRIAAGYINTYNYSLAEYADLLRNSTLWDSLHLKDQRDRSVILSIGLTFRRLDKTTQQTLAILSLDEGKTCGWQAVSACMANLQAASSEDVLDNETVQESLNNLVAHSLITREQHTESRYMVHPLVRRYVVEHLSNNIRHDIEKYIIHYYLDFVEKHARTTSSSYDALEAQHANIMAAMNKVYKSRDWSTLRRFIWALHHPDGLFRFLKLRGYWIELKQWLEKGIELSKAIGEYLDTARLLITLASLLKGMSKLAEAEQRYQQALRLFKKLNRQEFVASTYMEIGRLQANRQDYLQARKFFEQSLALEEKLGNQAGIANVLHQLGKLAQKQSNYAMARDYYQRSMQIRKALDDRVGMANSLRRLGTLEQIRGNHVAAHNFYERGLTIVQNLGRKQDMAWFLRLMGTLAYSQADYTVAHQSYTQSLNLEKESKHQKGIAESLVLSAKLAEKQNQINEALQIYEQIIPIAQAITDGRLASKVFSRLSYLYEKQAQMDKAEAAMIQAIDIDRRFNLARLAQHLKELKRLRVKNKSGG